MNIIKHKIINPYFRTLLGKYFDEISQDTGKFCFGVVDTLKVHKAVPCKHSFLSHLRFKFACR
jgi:hypothetical protein